MFVSPASILIYLFSLNMPLASKSKSLGEILSSWQNELDASVKQFHQQAKVVSKWDHVLFENSHKITILNDQLQQTESYHKELDQNLDYIEAQQTELSQLLESLETEVDTLCNQLGSSTSSADEQRQKSYELSEKLNHQLGDMVLQLNQIVREINTSSGSHQQENDESTSLKGNPVSEVVKILNTHLDSLQWIDQCTQNLKESISHLQSTSEYR